MEKETLGALIAEHRRRLGMTQLELANKLAVTDKAVSKWERDQSCPDINTLPKLAEIFGISLDTLMQTGTGETRGKAAEKLKQAFLPAAKAVALAMGVAVVVLSVLKQLTPETGMVMLGIGVACIGAVLLQPDPPAQ